MDYQLHIYPSSERELLSVRADNKARQIKVLMENKLPILYKKRFGTAVKKYNERAISGKLIDNYYKSVLESNVPEVYKMSLIIRYELLNQSEITAIQKAFTGFRKTLEKESYLEIVSVYMMTYDEYKELLIYFIPVSDGYAIGLSIKNDFIDVTKKLRDIKENINLAAAIPKFTEHMDLLFKPHNAGQFISQEELEAQAHNIKEEDPMVLHAIAVETLKAQMNALQKINAENQQLEASVSNEKQRIQNDLVWIKETEVKIYEAEKQRIEEEKRLAEEARLAEERRIAEEAQRKEIERLKEEERRVEAARLAEQARRNIELRRLMARQEEELNRNRTTKYDVTQDMFRELVEQHLIWQEVYNIDESVEYDNIPDAAMKDPRRLALTSANVTDVRLDDSITLIGASFNDCSFANSTVRAYLIAGSIANCEFINCNMYDIVIAKCIVNNVNVDRNTIERIKIDDSTIIKASAKNSALMHVLSAPGVSFVRCDFSESTIANSDLKKNVFANCDFTNTLFKSCDMRNASFQVSSLDLIKNEGSLFRGAQISKKK